MSVARNAILARLKKRTNAPANKPLTPCHHEKKQLSTAQCKALFIEKLRENRAEAHSVTQKNWKETLVKIAVDRQLNTWLLGGDLPEITQAATALSSASSTLSLIQYTQAYETLKSSLFHDVEASLTMAKAGIAETGTLVLVPDQHEPRMMSLTPPVHVVIIKSCDIKDSFEQLLDDPSWPSPPMPSNIVFISSPSKTADIQQTLAYGAHGPKDLIVLILSQEK